MRKHYTDRSRIVLSEKCERARLLQYHFAGTGIVPKRESVYTVVGGAVHGGLAHMIQEAQFLYNANPLLFGDISCPSHNIRPDLASLSKLEEDAVSVALMEYDNATQEGLELSGEELAALTPQAQEAHVQQLAASLGVSPEEAGLGSVADRVREVRSQFDGYLLAEQRALTEALVRAYCRRRLRPLLEQFEVLEVEREGSWLLSQWGGEAEGTCPRCHLGRDTNADGDCYVCHKWTEEQVRTMGRVGSEKKELWFMSRPDALLRERSTHQLYLLSFKTTGSWDGRKAKDIQHDMQGLSEGVEVERRLAEWWQYMREHPELSVLQIRGETVPLNMARFLVSLPAPPRILGVRYEFLLKGERWKDKDLSAQLGVEARSQRSHLIRQYVAVSLPKKGEAGYSLGSKSWSWDFIKEDGSSGSLSWQNWKSRPVFGEEDASKT